MARERFPNDAQARSARQARIPVLIWIFQNQREENDAQIGIRGRRYVAFGALGVSGAYAESMEVTSAEVHKGATIRMSRCSRASAVLAITCPRP